jgi:hypothetical protein
MSLIKILLPENEDTDKMFPDDTDSDIAITNAIEEEAAALASSTLPSFISIMY